MTLSDFDKKGESINGKEILKQEKGLVLVKNREKTKLFLEKYPNNILLHELESFIILVDEGDYLLLEVNKDGEKQLVEIKKGEKKDGEKLGIEIGKVKRLDKPIDGKLIEKDEISISYTVYKKDRILHITSFYIEGESNYQAIGTSEYKTKEEKVFKKKYFKESFPTRLLNLFKN